jgi:hypothetical protein
MLQKLRNVSDLLTISESRSSFIAANADEWTEFRDQSSDEWVLTDMALHFPEALVKFGVTSNYLASSVDARLLGLLDYPIDREATAVADSYGFDAIEYMTSKVYRPAVYIPAVRDAIGLYRGINSVEDLLDLEYDGILIGDLVYNTYLRQTGKGTLSTVEADLFTYLLDAVSYKKGADRIFSSYNITNYLASDLIYTRSGIPSRMAYQRGADVFVVSESDLHNIRVHDRQQLERHLDRPDIDIFEELYDTYGDHLTGLGENYINDRMSAQVSEQPVGLAYAGSKRTISRDELFEVSSLNPENPTVVVMAHAFSDGPYRGERQLFRDYIVWMRETLSFAADHPDTNWVVKEHPRNDHFGSADSVTALIDESIDRDAEHVFEFPEDVNTDSVANFADVIVTFRGTAGWEFSCFGIPAVLAGMSEYSNFGFTYEPANQDEYFELLADPGTLGPLEENRVRRAKALFAFREHVMSLSTDYLPNISEYETESEFWTEATDRIEGTTPMTDPGFKPHRKFVTEGLPHAVNTSEFARSSTTASE